MAGAKEKERTKVTKQSLLKERRKENKRIRPRLHPPQGINRTPPTGAYEATAPDWDEWHEDNCYAGQGWSYALYNEQQSYSHATFASNRRTRKKNKSNHREEAQVRIPGKIPCLTPTRVSIP